MSKTKKQKVTKNIKPVIAKAFYVSVTVAELGAVIALSLVEGDTKSVLARIVAVPLAMDFSIRLVAIVRPFFKSE